MNNDMNETQKKLPSETSVRDRVLSVIDETGVEPRSKYVYLCQNTSVWVLWVVSILFGALSIAVLMFVSTHRYYEVYEAMYDNFYTFMFEALPYIWFLLFGGMLGLASWQLKRTKRGYRFSMPLLGVSSFAFSIILGVIFHLGGFGWSLDMWLGNVAPMYVSQAEMDKKMWQNPAEGRLLGKVGSERSEEELVFEDVEGSEWVLCIDDLSPRDIDLLETGERVKVVGFVSEEIGEFKACGVMPWMLDEPPKLSKGNQERKLFIERMNEHVASEPGTVAEAADSCAEILPVKRMRTLQRN